MNTRTEIIPLPDLDSGEAIACAEVVESDIVLTIVRDDDAEVKRQQAGQRFLEFVDDLHSREAVDCSIWSDPDPRVRHILDR